MTDTVVTLPEDLHNGEQELTFDLGSVELWDLTEAFSRLLEETGGPSELSYDVARRTVDYYAEQILERVRQGTEIDFVDLFDKKQGRYELIGVFTALLEMMKQGFVRAHQDDATRAIMVCFVGPADATVDQILRGDGDPLEDEGPGPGLPEAEVSG
jgi:chromatin segregation and condensation protein Rec8/ScpA/Scc1 (kleisin family)